MLDSNYSQELVEKIRTAQTTEAKVQVLKDQAASDSCVILACGPSLNEYSPEQLRELCKDSVVLAIKQAFAYVPEVCDFLLLNTWNYQKYDFGQRRPVILYEKGPADPTVYGEHDIVFDLPRASDLSQQLARSKRYDDYAFDASVNRPWGPGVLYEIGFYLAHYMGFKSIVTLGWDVGAKSTSVMPHFYDRPSPQRTRTLAKSRWIRSLAERNRFLHEGGVLYNKPRIIPEEVEICAAASGDWYDWLTAQGIDLKIVSKGAIVDARIPRTRLEDVLGKAA
ncbi:hypothetical protein [Pseudodonghicola xiamenensis]|uniref:DUF115 domain-containing protein n=1 Tax=Pseudodonghicola xiamenensis TaxID=337702 RepID=A0A8J3MDA2_9RHOB|nr:hypothetical protein [Pseudodonghicola xiamenensis]GHG97629.1 hypothetical protein GCM10010961_32480 [Pseudodonghicola xiamenensis]